MFHKPDPVTHEPRSMVMLMNIFLENPIRF